MSEQTNYQRRAQPFAIVARDKVAQRVVYDVLAPVASHGAFPAQRIRVKCQNYSAALLVADALNAFALSIEIEQGGVGE